MTRPAIDPDMAERLVDWATEGIADAWHMGDVSMIDAFRRALRHLSLDVQALGAHLGASIPQLNYADNLDAVA